MANILVAYGTTDGQTEKIARFVADELHRAGATCDLVQPSRHDDRSPRGYDGVIVAGSVHIGRYQKDLERWVREHAGVLARTPSRFLSVSLAVLQADEKTRRDLARIVERFLAKTGWQPRKVEHVAGALRYTRYGWITRLMMRWIAGRSGGATDTTRDHEYTDWGRLRALVRQFFEECAAHEPAPRA